MQGSPHAMLGFAPGGIRVAAGIAGRLVVLALFAMGALVVIVGTQALRLASDADAQVMSESLLLGTVDNMLRGNDVAGAVSVRQGPEGDALVVRRGDGSDAYEVRLFLCDGHVMQETALAGTPIRADRAIPVVPSSTFSVEVGDGGILVTADDGQAFFATRSPMVADGSAPDGGADRASRGGDAA